MSFKQIMEFDLLFQQLHFILVMIITHSSLQLLGYVLALLLNFQSEKFMNILKILLAKLGFIKLVWLEDFDGELTLSVKKKSKSGEYYAYRYMFSDRIVKLLDDRSCIGIGYVKRWIDYE